jgi:hypothetical protein
MMALKENIYEILKAYTEKNHIAASAVILEEYAEEIAKSGLVVEVVRCKDCQYGDLINCECWCTLHYTGMSDSDFCSYGVAKMDGKGEGE